jgi:hypothetical protein
MATYLIIVFLDGARVAILPMYWVEPPPVKNPPIRIDTAIRARHGLDAPRVAAPFYENHTLAG